MATKSKLGSGKRFASLEKELAKKGSKDPAGLAAYIGMKKYGKKNCSTTHLIGFVKNNEYDNDDDEVLI